MSKFSISRLLFSSILTSSRTSPVRISLQKSPLLKSIFPSHQSRLYSSCVLRRPLSSSAASAASDPLPKKDPSGKDAPKISNPKPSTLSEIFSSAMNLPKQEQRIAAAKEKLDLSGWTPIYKFPKIRVAGAVQRLKLYQTAFTCFFAVPSVVGCYIYGIVGEEVVIMTSGVCGLACAMLYVMGNFFSRLIGFVYISKDDPEAVRIAHMTFWGNRKDEYYKKTDFVPFSDLPDNVSDIYIHVKVYDQPKSTMYISLKYGYVLDKEQFEEVFGGISELVVTQKSTNSKRQS